MFSAGLKEEARSVEALRYENALQTVGYSELFQHFDGDLSLEEAVEEIKKNSRRYAKRQLTWFRRDPDVNWFDVSEIEKIINFLKTSLDA
jgi:tRNA dimethylallyltransferase